MSESKWRKAMNGNPVEKPPEKPKQLVPDADVPDELLRKMNHRVWVGQFADVLEISPRDHGVPMTPFRMGAISRLRLAARYINLIEQENERLTNVVKIYRSLEKVDAELAQEDAAKEEGKPDDAPEGR